MYSNKEFVDQVGKKKSVRTLLVLRSIQKHKNTLWSERRIGG